MKRIIISLMLISTILIGCGETNSDDRYIMRLTLGDTLDVATNNLAVKESNDNYTKYYYRWYSGFSARGRDYYIIVDKKNVIHSIWTRKL